MIKQKRLVILLFTLPTLALYVYFFLSPIGEVVYFSFYKWDAISPKQFLFLDNYTALLKDPVFYKALLNTLYLLLLLLVVQIPLALLLAYLLFTEVKAFKFLRTIYFIPVIVSSVAIALVFQFIYEYNFGILNTLLEAVGLEHWKKVWLSNAETAMTAVSFPLVWKYVGLMMIILLAALQGISQEVLEAAQIDGASAFQRLVKVVIPMIAGIIGLCIVLAITSAFKQFDFILILTQGGPIHRTEVTGSYMYNEGFNRMHYGYGSTIAVAIMLIAVCITLLVKRLSPEDR